MCLSACASSETQEAPQGFPVIWDFRFVDTEQNPLGNIRIQLTEDPIDDGYCGEDYFRKAIVLEDDLAYDLGMEKQPAYHISLFALALDLTASVCHTNFILSGPINSEEASGFFNYAHPLGGYNIGRFTATPIVE